MRRVPMGGAFWCVGMFGRGYWTPDEPREADIAWRMSWQADKAVPLLAGEAFCEKPPLTYWVAGAPSSLRQPMRWAARLPNLLYALFAALGVGLLARRSIAGAIAGLAAAAAMRPSCCPTRWPSGSRPTRRCSPRFRWRWPGLYIGFYAERLRRERLRGYTCDARGAGRRLS
jgi:hypothetical protein